MKKYLVLALLVLLLGVLCDVSFARTCPQCNGKGGTRCGTCFGTGLFNGQQCTSCHGRGIYNICARCGGTGEIPDGGDENPSSENPGGELTSTIAIVKETSHYDVLNVGQEYPRVVTIMDFVERLASVKGGSSPYTWSVVEGNLPKGLSFFCQDSNSTSDINDNNIGQNFVLKGIPVRSGTYNFTLQVTDANGKSATRDFSITVEGEDIDTTPDPEPEPAPTATITITTNETLSKGTAGTTYTETLTAEVSNSNSQIVWSSSNLPSWLTLNSLTGTLTGNPSASGTYTFTVKATAGTIETSKEFTITIQPAPTTTITITKSSLASGTVGAAYSDILTADLSGVTWSVSEGSLPAGLTLNASTGTITGTPTKAGTFTFTVKAASGTNSAARQLRIIINNAAAPDHDSSLITIATNNLEDGTVRSSYSNNIYLSSDVKETEVWSWKISAGSLPPGLTLRNFENIDINGLVLRNQLLWISLSRTGRISGTSTTAGTYTFTVTASQGTEKASKQYTITIHPEDDSVTPAPAETVSITKLSLPSGTAGTNYNDAFTANVSGVTWSVSSGSLPAGLSLNSATGAISGTPTTAGTYTFIIKAAKGTASDTREYTMTVLSAEPVPSVPDNTDTSPTPEPESDTSSPSTPDNTEEVSSSGGGGGGCDSGFGLLGLALLAAILTRKSD